MNTKMDVQAQVSGETRVSDGEQRPEHRFFAADLCVDIARALVAPLVEIKEHDAEIWDQAYRALKGMALCTAEGGRRRKMDRANFFDMAAGSAQELRMALTLAVTFGAVTAQTITPVDHMLDRLLGMLWKLARRAEADAAIAKRRR
jgi:four helix bundle protein